MVWMPERGSWWQGGWVCVALTDGKVITCGTSHQTKEKAHRHSMELSEGKKSPKEAKIKAREKH